MSPWTLLGWLLLGLISMLIGGGVYLVGLWLNWPSWLPKFLALICLTPPLLAIIFKLLALFPPNRQKQAATKRPNALQATGWLHMLPVRLRHAADHLAEHEYPVHLVFLDRVPGCIALVI